MIGSHQLTVSEAMGVHEVLLETSTTIDKLAFYAEETRSHELETVFRAHQRSSERTYDELLGFARGSGTQETGVPQSGAHFRSTQGGQPNRQTIRPEPTGRIDDRTMVLDCLVGCKSIAVGAMTSATEASHPALRRTLADVSRQHLESAYELYKIAEQHGWYPSLQPHQSPEEWLRSTHLPATHQGVSTYASRDGGMTYTGATAGVGEAYQSRGYAHESSSFGRTSAANYDYQATHPGAATGVGNAYEGRGYTQGPSGYGQTGTGANYGYQASAPGAGNFTGTHSGVQYAAPDLEPHNHRH